MVERQSLDCLRQFRVINDAVYQLASLSAQVADLLCAGDMAFTRCEGEVRRDLPQRRKGSFIESSVGRTTGCILKVARRQEDGPGPFRDIEADSLLLILITASDNGSVNLGN